MDRKKGQTLVEPPHFDKVSTESQPVPVQGALRQPQSAPITSPNRTVSRVERDEVPPPGEEAIVRLATELGEDPDVLLAMAGKVSADLRAIILARPKLFADLIRSIKTMPDNAILKIAREVRDGEW